VAWPVRCDPQFPLIAVGGATHALGAGRCEDCVISPCPVSGLASSTSYPDAMGDVTFAVPYVQLGVLLARTVLASLAATIAPALSATRIRPAVALRIVARPSVETRSGIGVAPDGVPPGRSYFGRGNRN